LRFTQGNSLEAQQPTAVFAAAFSMGIAILFWGLFAVMAAAPKKPKPAME
jgi:hypothetical protein